MLVVFHMSYVENLRPQLDSAINASDKGTAAGNAFQPHTLLAGFETAGWVVMAGMVIGMIVDLVLSYNKEYSDDRTGNNDNSYLYQSNRR
jgi:predicted histidine transporter YuiF (NhaC family)